jgi:chromosomal replication initiator protein
MPLPTLSDAAHLWTRLQADLRCRVPESTFDIWLAPLRFGGLDGDRIIVVAPAEAHDWVAERLMGVLNAAARRVLGGATASVELREETTPGAPAAREPVAVASGAPATDLFADDHNPLNPKFTFEQFVIGDANRFAHAAALAVAELPGQAYNPLFIVGPPGVGKTHLLHGIGNYVRAYGGGLTVRYTTVERFTNEFIAALRAKDIDAFKRRYRRNDVLLVDDIQFLESKFKTTEELFHTFNALHETGSQLVLASDRPPRDMEALEERLRQRFESGLVVDIRSPDRATRRTVLRMRVHHDGVALADEEVLDVIADRVDNSVRDLESALVRVVAYASLTGAALDVELADEVLTKLYGRAARRAAVVPTIEHIQTMVAERFGLTREELLSPSRSARIAWPRQLAMYLAREHTSESLPAIGRRFGGRDHSTVLHAWKRAGQRLGTDPEAFAAAQELTARLHGVDPKAL